VTGPLGKQYDRTFTDVDPNSPFFFIQGSNTITVLCTLLVASRMLPQRIVTFVFSEPSKMATLLSFPLPGT